MTLVGARVHGHKKAGHKPCALTKPTRSAPTKPTRSALTKPTRRAGMVLEGVCFAYLCSRGKANGV
jgi:hypothetical protein